MEKVDLFEFPLLNGTDSVLVFAIEPIFYYFEIEPKQREHLKFYVPRSWRKNLKNLDFDYGIGRIGITLDDIRMPYMMEKWVKGELIEQLCFNFDPNDYIFE